MSTLDKKYSKAIVWKSEGKDGADDFFRAKLRAFFQLEGKTPLKRDALYSFVRWGQLLEEPWLLHLKVYRVEICESPLHILFSLFGCKKKFSNLKNRKNIMKKPS